ncbi:tRNA nucleotidyltransferase/poly(A) polymerase [Hyella patelloides LEGE 07179]|uniref:tRNA nucleotidyltransferase/poly(A) polymerase n=1 Tax=Hyella patelloides LEGE 07179 TaxID=945734 RepID=A0A563W2N6_9CYAN|nr:CCA tRNA nucleotidyltransferase [Hyella patelloides]VEP17936.1 tRNA nucleotidyltransferase/poly(A) polymerase [Hyella patelloides LEGE 07179]
MTLRTASLSLSFPDLPCDLDLLPTSAYLVGGAVRDALLGRKGAYVDLDFVVPEKSVETAQQIANYHRAGFVVLDEARQIARVVFPQGTLDFALQEGATLDKDLRRRDFTINAIAYNFCQQQAIDPLGGIQDLQRGIIRMVSPENLKDDPLRLLRAYRQAAQLGFQIDNDTREQIRLLAPLITRIAAERVQSEFNYILAHDLGNKWLQYAWEDGLVTPWFPTVDREKFAEIESVAISAKYLVNKWHNFGENCPKWLYLAKLATLVTQKPEIAESELEKLKYSRSHIKAVTATVKHLLYLQTLTSPLSLREQYFFFLEAKKVFPILATRAMTVGVDSAILIPLIERYLDKNDLVVHPQQLLTGNDLLQELQLQPSPIIGYLLTEIKIAHIEGKVSNKQEALEFASELLKRN